jgi:hypothetical protein
MGVIDTLGIADELAQDGVFTREQAERLARVSGRAATEALATKSDIDALRADIASFKADLERAVAQTRSDLEHAILVSRRELEVEIQAVNRDTIKWFAGILLAHGIAVIAVTVTLVKLL